MSDYVMVLGAGRGQLPIIELCKKYNRKVIVVSPKGDYPGFKLADICIYEDVREKEIVYEHAQKYDICAILTDQLDEGVVTAAFVSEKMNLNGISYDVAQKFNNKFIMRKEAEKAGVCVPQSFIVSTYEEAKKTCEIIGYPLMIKPVDSSASRGVFKIKNSNELLLHFDYTMSFSKERKIIIEEFIVGKEFVVESYTHNHTIYDLIVGHRDYFDIPDTFIPNATVFVDANSATTHIEKKIMEANRKIVKYFGLKFGITHGEYLYDEKNDDVYLVEIAARGGGVFISSDLIPLACGVNANDMLVRDVLNLSFKKPVLSKGASAYFCYLTPVGVVKKIQGIENVNSIEGVYKAFFDNIYVGYDSKSIKDKSSRKGPILVFGKSKDDCYNVIKNVKEQLNIELIDNLKNKTIIWN